MRHLFVPVSASILFAAVIFIMWMGATNVLQDTGQWFNQLDQVINATFFATMATISLAAASFLMGSVSDARRDVDDITATVNEMRTAANPDEVKRAETWLTEIHSATGEDIDKSAFDDGTKAYLIALRQKSVVERTLKDALLLSFFCFLFGLIEAMTLDLWIVTPLKKPENPASWLESIALGLQTYPGVFLDIVISSGFLIAGLYFLVRGARSLLSAGV